MSNYEITYQDIQAIIKYLRVVQPENANEEYATKFLNFLSQAVHQKVQDVALLDPAKLDALLSDFESLKRQ